MAAVSVLPAESGDEITWLSSETAAQQLGITTRTLYRFVNEGALPAYRIGRAFVSNKWTSRCSSTSAESSRDRSAISTLRAGTAAMRPAT
jgi:excisionase family DNA binding protein